MLLEGCKQTINAAAKKDHERTCSSANPCAQSESAPISSEEEEPSDAIGAIKEPSDAKGVIDASLLPPTISSWLPWSCCRKSAFSALRLVLVSNCSLTCSLAFSSSADVWQRAVKMLSNLDFRALASA